MANRSLARLIAAQSLFSDIFRKFSESEILNEIEYNVDTFAIDIDDETLEYCKKLVSEVNKNKEKLDSIIKSVADKWPLDKISTVDLSVLRLGLYELVFTSPSDVPPKVAIDEAIELAKALGGDSSRKFVNGVMATVYEEMKSKNDLPGEKKKEKKNGENNAHSSEEKVGALVYSEVDGNLFFAMIYDSFGFWTLPKGKMREGEDYRESVARKVKEEIALDVRPEDVGELIGETEYYAKNPEKGKTKITVKYYPVKFVGNLDSIRVGDNARGVKKAKFFHASDVFDLRIYDDIVNIISDALKTVFSR